MARARKPAPLPYSALLPFLTGIGGSWGLTDTGVVTGRGFAAPPVPGFGLGSANSWENTAAYEDNSAGHVFEYQPSELRLGLQRDFVRNSATQRPSYREGYQSDYHWSKSDPYYEPSEPYTGESDPYGLVGSPYATTGQVSDYDGRRLSGVASYSGGGGDQSEVSWGNLQAPWQATPSHRASGSSRALETVQKPYYDNINSLPGPQLKPEVPWSSYQTDFTAPAFGERAEVVRRLHQLYRRVKKKKPGYGRSGSRGGVRFPTSEEEQLPTGRPGLIDRETFATHHGGGVSTEEWLQYRGDRGDTIRYPVASKEVDHDIITVDNIHAWVDPPPRGPDVFTVNVESALNFSGR